MERRGSGSLKNFQGIVLGSAEWSGGIEVWKVRVVVRCVVERCGGGGGRLGSGYLN